MHFLVIDNRFCVPIFVFLECDPNEVGRARNLPGRWVILEPATSPVVGAERPDLDYGTGTAIGGDPMRPDRYAVFASDREVRAAGYAVIEPRYLGPTWETYLSVYHPEGGKRSPPSLTRTRVAR
jgi:hypothetical protein